MTLHYDIGLILACPPTWNNESSRVCCEQRWCRQWSPEGLKGIRPYDTTARVRHSYVAPQTPLSCGITHKCPHSTVSKHVDHSSCASPHATAHCYKAIMIPLDVTSATCPPTSICFPLSHGHSSVFSIFANQLHSYHLLFGANFAQTFQTNHNYAVIQASYLCLIKSP